MQEVFQAEIVHLIVLVLLAVVVAHQQKVWIHQLVADLAVVVETGALVVQTALVEQTDKDSEEGTGMLTLALIHTKVVAVVALVAKAKIQV